MSFRVPLRPLQHMDPRWTKAEEKIRSFRPQGPNGVEARDGSELGPPRFVSSIDWIPFGFKTSI